MTHYNRHYVGKPDAELDEDAIKDLKEWFSEKQWEIALQIAGQIQAGTETIQNLNMAFGFCGVSGRPFFAFCRRYCPAEFRVWCRDPKHGGPRYTDKDGYWIEDDATKIFAAEEEYNLFHDEPGAIHDDIACEGMAKKIAEWYGIHWSWSSWGGIQFLLSPVDELPSPGLPSAPPLEEKPIGMD